jgi:hypothetical protein
VKTDEGKVEVLQKLSLQAQVLVRILIELVIGLGIIPYLEKGLSLPFQQREQKLNLRSKQSLFSHFQ